MHRILHEAPCKSMRIEALELLLGSTPQSKQWKVQVYRDPGSAKNAIRPSPCVSIMWKTQQVWKWQQPTTSTTTSKWFNSKAPFPHGVGGHHVDLKCEFLQCDFSRLEIWIISQKLCPGSDRKTFCWMVFPQRLLFSRVYNQQFQGIFF